MGFVVGNRNYLLMRTYKVDGYYIRANSLSDAKQILSMTEGAGDRSLCLVVGDKIEIINFDSGAPVRVYTKSRGVIEYCGEIDGGPGYKLLNAAINSLNIQQSELGKLNAHKNMLKRNESHQGNQNLIKSFEDTVPENAKNLFNEVMTAIGATTEAYKLDIVLQIHASSPNPSHDNWLPILMWFREHVLATVNASGGVKSLTALRKAFVTTVTRMVAGDVRSTNTMRRVKEEKKDADWWKRYAEEAHNRGKRDNQ